MSLHKIERLKKLIYARNNGYITQDETRELEELSQEYCDYCKSEE